MNASNTRAVRTRLAKAGTRRSKAEAERSAASQALAEAIRLAAKGGMGPTEIASEAGISRQAVHKILNP